MNITPEMRKQNKQEFLSLISQIQRDGISDLINFLEKSDFFTAPASIKMYRAEEGGLCAHALARYKVMKSIISANDWLVDNDSFLITSLLADLNKINYFEPTCVNKKVYSEGGKKMETPLALGGWILGVTIGLAVLFFIIGLIRQSVQRKRQ